MAANPNSNLFFDFPDPSPRFEFDDSPSRVRVGGNNGNGYSGNVGGVGSKTPAKGIGRTRRLGRKFGFRGGGSRGDDGGANKNGGRAGDNVVDGQSSPSTSSSSSSSSPSSPDRCCDHSKDGYTTATTASASMSGDECGSSSAARPAVIANRSNHSLRLLPHAASSSGQAVVLGTSSCASHDMSEFSFDRVTVITNETGCDSYGGPTVLDWGFDDSGPIRVDNTTATTTTTTATTTMTPPRPRLPAPAIQDRDAIFRDRSPIFGRTRSAASSSSDRLGPPVKAVVRPSPPPQQSAALNLPDRQGDASSDHHHVSYDGSCDRSVISEISERTGAFSLGGGPPYDAAVGELLGEATAAGATDDVDRHRLHRRPSSNGGGTTGATASSGSRRSTSASASNREGGQQQQQQSQQRRQAAPSANGKKKSSSGTLQSLIEDVQLNYAMFKASRNQGRSSSSGGGPGGVLQWIAEDVQFCGWYLCGIDTTIQEGDEKDDACARQDAKEARKKAAESTFLGRDIEVPGCGMCSTMICRAEM